MKYSNKEIGNASLGTAIGYFTNIGCVVSIPLNDTQDYDLLVDFDGIIKKVQVKGTSFKTNYGIYQVSLKSTGGTRGKIYKTVKNTEVDLVFVATDDGSMYLIPKDKIRNTSSINLNAKYQDYQL